MIFLTPCSLLFLFPLTLATCPVGTIYESSFNKCYQYISQDTSFLAAEKSCNSLGGSLVTVSNAFENSFISGIAAATSPSPSYWIGVNYLMAAQWSWSNGDNSSFVNWAPGQPADPSIYQCGAIRDVDNMWTKELCNTGKPFMCQIDPDAAPVNNCEGLTTASAPVTVTTTKPTGCPATATCSPGYTLYNGTCQCYRFNPWVDINYNQSLAICANESAFFPIIHNEEANNFISQFTIQQSRGMPSFPWIGLYCYDLIKSNCIWPDGTHLSGYSNFEVGSPHGPSSPTWLDESSGQWGSSHTDVTGAYICQKNPIIP